MTIVLSWLAFGQRDSSFFDPAWGKVILVSDSFQGRKMSGRQESRNSERLLMRLCPRPSSFL